MEDLFKKIQRYNIKGHQHLKCGNFLKTLKYFKKAFKNSLRTDTENVQCKCAFNLGSIFIVLHHPETSLSLLRKAVPHKQQQDSQMMVNLYFNFSLAYELLKNNAESVKYLELALDELSDANSSELNFKAQISEKAAELWYNLKNLKQAARLYGTTSRIYKQLNQVENQLFCLSKQAQLLYSIGCVELSLEISNSCLTLLNNESNSKSSIFKPKARVLYNDLGLIYAQCYDYVKASLCFKKALKLCSSNDQDKQHKATLLQNLAAVFNSRGDHRASIKLHEQAIECHAKLGHRSGQGQCFLNLAYAYSELADYERAREYYLHALQASKDTEDDHSYWQSLEGLGAVAFNLGQYGRAINYFNQALIKINSNKSDYEVQKRIVLKLTDAIQSNFSPADYRMVQSPRKDVISDSSVQMEPTHYKTVLSELQNLQRHRLGVQNFDKVAHGISDYDSDTDRAILARTSSLKKKNLNLQSKNSSLDEVDIKSHSTSDSQSRQPIQIYQKQPSIGHKRRPVSRSGSANITNNLSDLNVGRRAGRPLLRSADHDSEEEWKQNMNKLHHSSDSDLEYKNRYHPRDVESSSSDTSFHRNGKKLKQGVKKFKQKLKKEYNRFHENLSDHIFSGEDESSNLISGKNESLIGGISRLMTTSAGVMPENKEKPEHKTGNKINEIDVPGLPPNSLIGTYEKPVNKSPEVTDTREDELYQSIRSYKNKIQPITSEDEAISYNDTPPSLPPRTKSNNLPTELNLNEQTSWSLLKET